MEPYNIFHDELDIEQDRPGFSWRRARLAPRLGAAELGLSVFDLPPGERTFPHHFHHANEEWVLVVSGEPTLREVDSERLLRPGDTVAFPAGAGGVHQLRNDSGETVRLALISTQILPDVLEYPDSGKVGVRTAAGDYDIAREPELDYWEGEA